ncbi:MAG TPA: glycoside hydrolase domain-containing protein [Candidatus Sulfotelmatobacter sp.]|nr:glycoside hydrolase domain-containing protein [Candidatus Sulfotelmatobacter sp.]
MGINPDLVRAAPPCACYYVGTNCTQFPSVYSSDPSTDGAQAADAAIAAAQTLGLTAPIIYTDVENYYVSTLCTSSQQTAAGQAVQAYVDGWDTEMHLNGGHSAGVYANATPINKDISQTSTVPDDIWIARTPGGNTPPQATIWNQGIKDSLWPNGQRIHQFLIDQAGVTWGGTALKINEDIDDASLANANAGAIPCRQRGLGPYTTFAYAGATSTWAQGNNDNGELIGYYYANATTYGYVYSGGVLFTSFSYPGSAGTALQGGNDFSQSAGYYYPTASSTNTGFVAFPAQ